MEAMKILVAGILLLGLGLVSASPAPTESKNVATKETDDDLATLIEKLVTSQEDDDDDDDLSEIQVAFNALAQINDKKAKSNEVANNQFWGFLGKHALRYGVSRLGKKYCKNRSKPRSSCNKEQEEEAALQEILEAQDDSEDDDEDHAELQALFKALNAL